MSMDKVFALVPSQYHSGQGADIDSGYTRSLPSVFTTARSLMGSLSVLPKSLLSWSLAVARRAVRLALASWTMYKHAREEVERLQGQ
jgi:hypothetical protein